MAALLFIGGLALAFGSAIGGFVLGHGNPMDLVHPAEMVIIFGIAASITLVSSPFPVLMRMISDGFVRCVRSHRWGMVTELPVCKETNTP